jgi:hypothetical protein
VKKKNLYDNVGAATSSTNTSRTRQIVKKKIDALYGQGAGFNPLGALSKKKPVERKACPKCKGLSIRECQGAGLHKCMLRKCKETFKEPITVEYWGKSTPNGHLRQAEEEWMHQHGILGEYWGHYILDRPESSLVEFARKIMKAKMPVAYEEVRRYYPDNGRVWPSEDRQLPAHRRPRSSSLYPGF